MSQTLSASALLAVPLAPLAGALAAGILGTSFGGNWIGRRLSHTLTILGVLVAFIISAMTLKSVAIDGARFNETLYTWMNVGGLKMEIGFLVDGLTAMMMCVVTFVSLMVHIYTIGYMEEDEGYNRFFAYISLFTFSMLMLVMSNNMLQLFFGWEAVGLVSYLLIGFWFNKPTAIFANMKAFLVNRVGDFGFILGIGLIAAYAGTLNYGEAFAKADELSKLSIPGHRLDAGDRDLHLPLHRRHGQVGAVPLARLAAGFHGRPDPDLRADSRGDHGDRRHLHGGAHVAAV
jgi:NADH-quinone oxidoreductase subunit L